MLLLCALPWFCQSAFEMYFLTVAQGPQMLFFSFLHRAPELVISMMQLSILAFLASTVYNSALLVGLRRGKFEFLLNKKEILVVVLVVQLVHITLLLTYFFWAGLFG